MFGKLKNGFNFIIIFFGLSIGAFGQTIGFFSIDQALDSNPFRLPVAESSWISVLSMGVQHNTDDFSLSYTGNYSRFDTFSARNYYWHQAALFAEKNNFQYGVLFEQTINTTEFDTLSSRQFTGYINSYFNIGEFNIYGNLEGNLNYYPLLEDLDNFNLDVGLKMQKSFETGTTIILGSILHYKKYLTNIIVEQSQSTGTGRHGSNNIYSEYDALSVSQLQYWIRLAQSVTKTTGLAAQYQSRIMIGGTSRYFTRDYLYSAVESQIFDDPLGYENQSYGVELTQLIPLGIVLKGAYYKNTKEYVTQGIYIDAVNYDFDQLRKDTRTNAWVSIQKRIASKFLGSNNISVNLTHQWMDNNSNSYWYNYQSNYTSLGLSINF